MWRTRPRSKHSSTRRRPTITSWSAALPPNSATVRDQNIDDAYAAMNAKFWGAYRVARKASVAPGGSFVFVSGFLSRRPKPNMVLIGAINAALETLAQGLALEMAPVRFTWFRRHIDTPTRAAMPAEARKTMLENVAKSLPVKRVGQAEDCADQILLMLRNTFMTEASSMSTAAACWSDAISSVGRGRLHRLRAEKQGVPLAQCAARVAPG